MLSLMIVDDESSVVNTLSVTIDWRSLGIVTVHKAFSAQEALDILHTVPVDIVLTDIQMPVVSGLELVNIISERWPRTRCILLSGHAEFEYAQAGIRSQIKGYLLKPVSDEALIQCVSQVAAQLREELSRNDDYERAIKMMRDHLPRLRREFLLELLQGKRFSDDKLQERLTLLELPVRVSDPMLLALVRFHEDLSAYTAFEMSLMEFAVGNMAEETFDPHFHVWISKDQHEHLVLLLLPRQEASRERHTMLCEQLAGTFQMHVQHYLKKQINVLLGQWGTFPHAVDAMYTNLLLVFGKRFGTEDLPVYRMDSSDVVEIQTLKQLYAPPTLPQLLEAGHWEAVQAKLTDAMQELEEQWAGSAEHVTEAFCYLFSAFAHIAHRNGRQLSAMIDEDYLKGKTMAPTQTVEQLREWVNSVYGKLRAQAMQETRTARTDIVKEAQKYMLAHLSQQISLQEISDHMHLHPAYLSRVYKLEAGENISEYMTRLKLEKAVQLLTHSSRKIYEIAMDVGYQNPNYFNKVFKKHFGLTAQEYRSAKRAELTEEQS